MNCFRNDKRDYAYDANGNLVSRTSGGQTLNFVYDAENRPVSVSGAATATFVYDGDVRGRLTKETKTITGGGTFVTEWAYDAADLPTWMRYPDGEQVTTSYLRQKLVNGVSGTSVYVQSTQYDAAGRLELRLLGSDQVRIDPHYHPWTTQGGRMHWLMGRVGSAGAFLQGLEYAYDAAGNVVRIVDTVSAGGVQTQSFDYDRMDRLLSAAATGGSGGAYSESYSYDSAGRLVNGPRGNGYVYGDAAHKHAVTAVSGGHSYVYDANGNLVSRTSGGQTLSFVYDAENRLVSVSGAATATFVYDGDGRRVKGTVNGVTTYYIGDHYEVSAGVVKKYYIAGGQRIALRSGGTLYWLLNDHLGATAHTISGVTETGEVRYRAFGVTRFTSGTTPTSVRFTGQREEAALGLYFYNARWYDPALGRFIQPDTLVPDPADARMFDRYAYVNNNPLKFNDPTGHEPHLPNDPCSYEHCRWDPLAGKYVRVSYAPPDMQFEPQVDPKLAALTELLRRAATIQLHYTEQGEIDFQKTLETELGEAMSVCAKAVGGVCGVSLGASGSVVALGGKASADFFVDQQGEMAGYLTAGGGGYAVFTGINAGVSGLSGIAIHNASVDNLQAWSVQFGGSGKMVGGLAVDWLVGKNHEGKSWHGLSLSSTGGYGLEIHGIASYSWQVYRSGRR